MQSVIVRHRDRRGRFAVVLVLAIMLLVGDGQRLAERALT